MTDGSDAGRQLRRQIEADTDRFAARPVDAALDTAEQQQLLDLLAPPARDVVGSGILPSPNPMGLPRFD